MDTIITQVQNLAVGANEAGRKQLIDSLRNLQYAIETPYDTLQRFAGLVGEPKTLRRRHAKIRSIFKSLPHVSASI